MGAQASQILYSVPVTEKKVGETSVYRSPLTAKNGLLKTPIPELRTMQDVMLRSFQKYGDLPFLHSRDKEGRYQGKSFNQVFRIAEEIGAGIAELKLNARVKEYESLDLSLVAVLSKNREEWLLLEYANFLYGNTMVPLYDTLGVDNIKNIINKTNIVCIFCSLDGAKNILMLEDFSRLNTLVIFDELSKDVADLASSKGLRLLTLGQVQQAGRAKKLPFAKINPTDLVSFSYTSGTTGEAKATMLTHANFVCAICVTLNSGLNFSTSDVHLSYLPLAHVDAFSLFNVNALLYGGTPIYFYSGDVLKLNNDILTVRPTVFLSVPRLYNRFFTGIQESLAKKTGMEKKLIDRAIKVKLENLHSKGLCTHAIYDQLVFNKIKASVFGGRVRFMVTGAAPISKEVLDFMKICAPCPIIEGYGQTETMGPSFFTHPEDPLSGHVGGPTTMAEFKLIDIPEMGYLSTDKDEKGNPAPRGEVCIRGPGCLRGYYKEPLKSKETLDDEGFVHTGDVAIIFPNGSLKLIDRRKNLFKLAQGEFVAPEKVENILLRAPGVQECFIYGESLKPFLIGVIVPSKDYVEAFAKEKGIQGDFADLCKNEEINKKILENINEFSSKEKLNLFERPKRIHLEPVSFLLTGCCTPSFKLKRDIAKARYKGVLEHLYALH